MCTDPTISLNLFRVSVLSISTSLPDAQIGISIELKREWWNKNAVLGMAEQERNLVTSITSH